jgi:hypothetical protein
MRPTINTNVVISFHSQNDTTPLTLCIHLVTMVIYYGHHHVVSQFHKRKYIEMMPHLYKQWLESIYKLVTLESSGIIQIINN